ncbi:probable kinetochore protein NUF2 [Tanacetum coccineum]
MVVDSKLHRLCSLVFRHWDWASNGAWCNKGTRIIMGWNHNDVDVVVITQDDQAIHTRIWLKAERKEVFCSFIYAHNRILSKYVQLYRDAIHLEPKTKGNEWPKIQWFKEGDSNSAYFHKVVKSRVSRSRIDVVTNIEGVVFENNEVSDAFVSHYETFLGLAGETNSFNTANLFTKCLNEQVASGIVRNVTTQEVKEALFSIGDDKSPGPDGYTAAFFKEAWDVVANDVTNAICEFFRNGTLLKEINHTIIALIPKVKSPTLVNDYRPILCCNELMHNYHLDRGTPRCAFKVDIQKAYDTVDYDFLRMVLYGFGFHDRMISWIMELCTTYIVFYLCVNGSLHGYFKGKRGLRQGDPLSPYLFTLVMEVLTFMLQRKVKESDLFTYHRYCSKLELINLCFADDLFLFAYGDVHSASVIKEALDEFKGASGLSFLLMRGFMSRSLKKGKSKVAWEVVCLPKDEGGLGIRRLECFNSALMVAHIWKLLSLKESLWVKWIHEYKLNRRNFWDIPLRGNMSWGWRKILQLRPIIREFIWCKIRDGASTSLWFDKWCDLGPLASRISSRDIFRAGLNLASKVKDITQNGTWLWPPDLLVKYHFLSECHAPIVEDNSDVLVCHNSQGLSNKFSVAQVWSDIHYLGTVCSLCGDQPDSHDHLFFECSFAHVIWDRMIVLVGLDSSPPNIYDIINDLLPIARRRSMKSVVAKLVVTASAYFIWQERNWRLFNKCNRTPTQDVRGDPEQRHKTFLRSFIDRAFLLQRGNVATVKQEVAATVESMEKAARYTSNKYVEAALNSTTIVLPYLVPVKCFSSLYLSDQQLYKFVEGNFPQLHLNNIEDMLILVVQNKLFNLKDEDIMHLKKLNISRPLTHKSGITDLEPYTTYSNPQGVIYLDKLERNRLMCSHELYKFSDGTLISVWDKLKDMLNNLEMGYTSVMPRRRWSNVDKKWSRVMMKDIDRQLLERRLMKSLGKFIGGREYEEDLRLLQRII